MTVLSKHSSNCTPPPTTTFEESHEFLERILLWVTITINDDYFPEQHQLLPTSEIRLLNARRPELWPFGPRPNTVLVHSSPGAHPAPCTMLTGLFAVRKAAGAWRWTLTPPRLKKEKSYTSTLPLCLHDLLQGKFTFSFTKYSNQTTQIRMMLKMSSSFWTHTVRISRYTGKATWRSLSPSRGPWWYECSLRNMDPLKLQPRCLRTLIRNSSGYQQLEFTVR